ncbi:MAG: hypothetical protein NTY01_05060 [Verrucomicrobia bacterium]|nr:hypothetical protein [Verrucomicrobiota bacterium]
MAAGRKVLEGELLIAVRALRRAPLAEGVGILLVQSRFHPVGIQNVGDMLELAPYLRRLGQQPVEPAPDSKDRKGQQQPARDKYGGEKDCKNAKARNRPDPKLSRIL